jgi:hypothetical protein
VRLGWICWAVRLTVLACVPGSVWADQQQSDTSVWQGTYVQADSQALSNGMPVVDMDGPWLEGYQRRGGTQRAYQSLLLEAGVAFNPGLSGVPGTWRLGLLRRAEAFLSMSGDTAELLALYQRRQDPAAPTPLDLDHQSLAWQGRGLRLETPSWRPSLPDTLGEVQLSLSMQWLSLDRLRTTRSQGDAAYSGGGTYTYQASLQDDNSRVQIPFVLPPASRGHGWSVSWALQGQLPALKSLHLPVTRWSLTVSDAWSRLNWRGVNGSDASLSSNTSTRTPEGYINYEPALTTTYTERNLRARIPTAVNLNTQWQADSGWWFATLHHRWGLWQTWLGWQHPGPWQWLLAVDPQAGALQAGVDRGGFRVRLMADHLGKAAHAQAVSVRYVWDMR